MKTIALFILCLGLATGAHAQQVVNVVPEKSPAPAAPGMSEADAADAAKAAESARVKDRFADRNCLRHTGSRALRAAGNNKGRKCAIGNGQAYTREDLESTGGMDIGSALRSLHPGIR